MRALVLDDDPSIGRLIGTIAAPLGFTTDLTHCAAQFRSSYEATVPNVILLDLQIGDDTDGVEQLRFLSSKGYENPLILMSGFDDRVLGTAEQLAKSLGLCLAAALCKPFRADQLQQVLQRIDAEAQPITGEQLLQAVELEELALEYQPIVTPDRKEVLHLEALLRWEHPHLGRLAPDRFIPVAENESEVIDAVTDWVVSTAARQYQQLHDLGLVAPIAVNLSGRNLHDVHLPDRIRMRLRDAHVPAEHFCLELTETAVALDPSRTMDILSRLRLMGMQLALDDFGTGYSSLQQLRRLPFSALKIDRSFVADLPTSRDSLAIVKSIIDLARNMGLKSVAEGVETEKVAAAVIELGVDALQGYLIARPLPADQVAGWLRGRRSN
jgi:EAL domain-containing protein (putative c-di-GMP-specific phosphodiesterase class I)